MNTPKSCASVMIVRESGDFHSIGLFLPLHSPGWPLVCSLCVPLPQSLPHHVLKRQKGWSLLIVGGIGSYVVAKRQIDRRRRELDAKGVRILDNRQVRLISRAVLCVLSLSEKMPSVRPRDEQWFERLDDPGAGDDPKRPHPGTTVGTKKTSVTLWSPSEGILGPSFSSRALPTTLRLSGLKR